MRHWFICMVAGLLVLTMGCSRTQPNQPPAQSEPDDSATPSRPEQGAVKLVSQFMQDRLARKPLDPYLGPGVEVTPSLSNPHMVQYTIRPESAGDSAATFLVESSWEYTGHSAGLLVEKVTVQQADGKYLIASVEKEAEETVEITGDYRLVLRTAAGEQEILDTRQDLPETVQPYGADPGVAFGPSHAIKAVAIHNGLVAFQTGGEVHVLLGAIQLKGRVPAAETRLHTLDLHFEGGPGELVFSPDGKFLAETAGTPKPAQQLYVWDTSNWTRMQVDAPEDVHGLRWEDGKLLYEGGGTTGTWMPPAEG